MNILLLNQCFWPDLQATAQHASDLARELVGQGHSVTVVAGRRAYGQPEIVYPAREDWEGVRILRVGALDFGKTSWWRRAANFASFLIAAAWKLVRTPPQQHVIALTTPPLITVLGAAFTKIKGGCLHSWIMDLNPDEAIAAGWLPENSPVTWVLQKAMAWSLRHSTSIIVLDRFMAERIQGKLTAKTQRRKVFGVGVRAGLEHHVEPGNGNGASGATLTDNKDFFAPSRLERSGR